MYATSGLGIAMEELFGYGIISALFDKQLVQFLLFCVTDTFFMSWFGVGIGLITTG